LLEPDEIWVRLEWLYALGKAVVRRRYIARFAVEGQEVPALAVFELGSDGWAGVTTFQGAAQTSQDWGLEPACTSERNKKTPARRTHAGVLRGRVGWLGAVFSPMS
jgi:hypothetical protein